jgi:hypothetical protein
MATLFERIEALDPEHRKEVADFVEFLSRRPLHHDARKPTLAWRGALRDLRDTCTSVDLQHDALRKWGS